MMPVTSAAEDHGPAAHAVRELAEEQQRGREHERVDGEDEREHEAVEAESIAVDAVERRCQVGAEQQRGERARDDRLAGSDSEA